MSSQPSRPAGKEEVLDERTKRMLDERLKTIRRDEKNSVDARQALSEIRKSLKHSRPR
jgi:hypothetical protein